MNLEIFPDQEALSRAAARRFGQIAATAVAEYDRFTVALSGGGTPQRLYQLLALPPYVDEIPWHKTHFFWGDERLVSPEDPGSNYGRIAATLFDKAPIPTANIHRARGELDPAAAVADYTQQLRQLAHDDRRWPRFDLVLLGMGSDGHTASLFPGPIPTAELEEPVIAVTADYDGRPAHRITLTPLVFNDAHHILFLATGAGKAKTLAAVLNGPYDPIQWPAQRIRSPAAAITWLVDEPAARYLSRNQ